MCADGPVGSDRCGCRWRVRQVAASRVDYDMVVAVVDEFAACRTVRASRAAAVKATVTRVISIRFPLGSVTRPTRPGSRGFASPTYAGFALSLVRDTKLVDAQPQCARRSSIIIPLDHSAERNRSVYPYLSPFGLVDRRGWPHEQGLATTATIHTRRSPSPPLPAAFAGGR